MTTAKAQDVQRTLNAIQAQLGNYAKAVNALTGPIFSDGEVSVCLTAEQNATIRSRMEKAKGEVIASVTQLP